MIRRLLAILLSLALIAAFYVFAVMMEDEETKRSDEFLVQAAEEPLERTETLQSADTYALAQAFGVALPMPEGLKSGSVKSGSYHGYTTRLIALEGEAAQVTGIRPASAAPGILPEDLVFLASDKALLGYELLRANRGDEVFYALLTGDAAFLITPLLPPEPGGFSLAEP